MGECGAVEIDLDLRRRTVLPLFGSSFLLLTGAKRGVVRRPVTAALTASTPPASLQDITATATVATPTTVVAATRGPLHRERPLARG